MTEKVRKKNEISLDSVRFPIKGEVMTSLVSTFPGKVVIGDYDKDSEQISSNWIINDQRGGMLVEEMDESVHLDRCYWTTCNIRHKGHIVLNDLVSEIKSSVWTSPTGFVDSEAGWVDETKAYDGDTATFTYGDVTAQSWGDYLELTHSAIDVQYIKLKPSGENGNITKIDIDAYYDSAWNNVYEGTLTLGSWITKDLGDVESVTSVRVRFWNNHASTTYYGSLYELYFGVVASFSETPTAFANYNDKCYLAVDNDSDDGLYTLNSTADYFENIIDSDIDSNITDLVPHGDYLFIFSDDEDYCYLDSDEAVTAVDFTPVTDHKWGVSYNGSIYTMDDDGNFYSSAAPEDSGTAWSTLDSLPLAVTPQGLDLYRDEDGDFAIYCRTTGGLYSYDATNDVWQKTDLKLPEHSSCGKGFVHWREAAYISAGLDVLKYQAGSTVTVAQAGLNQDDGLPSEYRGEIQALIEGYNEFWALVDSSQVSGTGYSTLMSYNGSAWMCTWEGSTADDTMHCGIVSSASDEYRLYFDHDSKIYYIDLSRDMLNPLKISTKTYAASGIHITPWFDGGVSVYDKLALRLKIFCDDISTTETVTIKYRIDHENTDLDTGWTTLETLDSANDIGEKVIDFVAGEGLVFKSIQFRFDLARGSTTTSTPDIQWVSLSYIKLLPAVWGYNMTVDCTHKYGIYSPFQLQDKLNKLVETQTLFPFTYRNYDTDEETHYVRIANARRLDPTGNDYRVEYELKLVAP